MTMTRTLRYVLSAGRTGTVYLEKLLNRKFDGVKAVHEPAPTRYHMMLANLRNDYGIGGKLLSSLFDRSRMERIESGGDFYIEINPFLCPLADLLPKSGYSLRVVHAIRDPADWAVSITGFKASTRYRRFVDHVPFAQPFPSPRPSQWASLNQYERALWRWNWCNQRIASLRPLCEAYAIVRYEDLFSTKEKTRSESLNTISEILALPGKLELDHEELGTRENAFATPRRDFDKQAAERICGQIAREFGYAY